MNSKGKTKKICIFIKQMSEGECEEQLEKEV